MTAAAMTAVLAADWISLVRRDCLVGPSTDSVWLACAASTWSWSSLTWFEAVAARSWVRATFAVRLLDWTVLVAPWAAW